MELHRVGIVIPATIRHLVTAFLCAFLVLALPSPAAALRESPDRFGGTNGRIYAVLKVKGSIYVGGSFTAARSRGGGFQPRANLAAFDASSGNLKQWSPRTDGTVYDLARSRGGGKIYAGGAFSTVNSQNRKRLVALRSGSGSVIDRFKAGANNTVRAIARSGSRLYIGGSFTRLTRVGTTRDRGRLAAVTLTRGLISRKFKPRANGTVRALAFAPGGDRLYAGGDFTQANGLGRRYLARFAVPRGRVSRKWTPNLRSVGPCGFGCVQDLATTKKRVYAGTGGRRQDGNSIYSFGAGRGRRLWSQKGNGDFHSVVVRGGKVYAGGHFLQVGPAERRRFATFDATQGGLRPYSPSFDKLVRTVEFAGGRLYVGGDFTHASGARRDHIARFSSA